jgi:hypothetical protein
MTWIANHGLRTPNEAFCHWNPELLGLSRQIGKTNSGAIGVIFGWTISTHFGTVSPNISTTPITAMGAGNVYFIVLSSRKVNIAENPIAVMGL